MQILDSIDSIVTQEGFAIQMLYLPQSAVKGYTDHIQAEIKSNSGRQLIKFIYIAGISLSVIATGYLLDKHIRKSLKETEEEEKEEKL